jgi:RNA polymerase sigma-70 factor, ECF subfamily
MLKVDKRPLLSKLEQPSDEQLAVRVTAGERSALSLLVERHHGPLLGYLYRLTEGDRSLAEDLVQETFMRVLCQESYQPGRPFKPWLYAIATNLAHDHFRSPASRKSESTEDDTTPELRDESPSPEELTQVVDRKEVVMTAVRKLGWEYRTVLLLRYYQGLSLQEIAGAMNLPLGTVKSRLFTGTRRLRDLLSAMKDEVE